MFQRWMRIIICAILMIVIVGNLFTAEGSGDIRIIVKLQPGRLIGPVLSLLGAVLLDAIPAVNLYLLRVSTVPVLTFLLQLLGVVYIENDTIMKNPTFENVGLLTTESPPDFYLAQPALTLIRAKQANKYYGGSGAIVDAINTRADFHPPAPQRHLTARYEFAPGPG